MSLQPETLLRIDAAAKAASGYSPNDATNAYLGSIHFNEFIGPAAGGKSTIMSEMARIDPDFSSVSSFTTREREARDVSTSYTYFNSDEEINQLLNRIENREAVQYVVHPTTKKLYGSFPEDYHTKYAMLDTLFNNVDNLDRLAFHSIHKIAVVSEGKEWIQRFLERYPAISEERTKRIQEAKLCLEWVQNQPRGDLLWVANRNHFQSRAAQSVINLVKYGEEPQDLSFLAVSMYDEAQKVTI